MRLGVTFGAAGDEEAPGRRTVQRLAVAQPEVSGRVAHAGSLACPCAADRAFVLGVRNWPGVNFAQACWKSRSRGPESSSSGAGPVPGASFHCRLPASPGETQVDSGAKAKP